MSGHTKEPWRVLDFCRTAVVFGADEGGFDLRGCPSPEANARRIVAAVNACAGISTELLEAMPDFEKAGVQTISSVQQQRDELLAALERAAKHIGEITTFGGKYHGLTGAIIQDSYAEAAAAQKAIANVKGQS